MALGKRGVKDPTGRSRVRRPRPPEAKPLRVASTPEADRERATGSAAIARRGLVTFLRYLMAVALFILGSMFLWWGIGIVPLVLGLALILPKESLKAALYAGGVARHKVGDPAGPAGVGAVLRTESREIIGEISRSIGVSTNTVADYTALIEGLEMALDNGVEEINVYVDSAVVAGHLVDGYRVRADHLRPLVERVRQLLDSFGTWSLTRVPRRLNLDADQLANLAIDEAIGGVNRPLLRSIAPVPRFRRRADAA